MKLLCYHSTKFLERSLTGKGGQSVATVSKFKIGKKKNK